MKQETYEKLGNVTNLGDVIDSYINELGLALNEANTQAENGNHLGMAVAVGRANSIADDLRSVWAVVKNN